MRSEQDARTNPIPGDVLQKGRTYRKVAERWVSLWRRPNEEMVTVKGKTHSDGWVSLTAWRAWAADADVLHVQQGAKDGE